MSRALHSPRGPPRGQRAKVQSQNGALVPPKQLNQTAEPRCPHTPTPLVSCQRSREAASSRAAAVGEAISGTERPSSHLAACRVRVQAEITARRGWHPAGIVSSCPTAPTTRLSALPRDQCCGSVSHRPGTGGHRPAVPPCPPRVAPGTALSSRGLPMAGDAGTAGCPTLQETLKSPTLFWLVG